MFELASECASCLLLALLVVYSVCNLSLAVFEAW